MEDLIDSFAASEVTPQENSTARDHPLFSLYKAKPSAAGQEERRKRFLEAQKVKRYDYAAHARGLATNEWKDKEEEEETTDESDSMELEEECRKPPRSHRNQLMLSEWLVEVPCDLESQWLLVPCPVGKRCLVVASRGITKVYTKSGYLLNSFTSKLPGGGRSVAGAPLHVYCLLDCVYSEIEKTFYILDVMCWNSHPCFDSDAEFRFFWLKSKIAEYPEVKERTRDNPYVFHPLTSTSCEKEKIKEVLFSPFPFEPKLDGLLFYHKRAQYTSSTTPLVGWLKAYMVPEMLHIDIPNALASQRPDSYQNMRQHLPDAFRCHELRKAQDERQMQVEEE